MKTNMITEFVKIEALQTTTEEQLLAKAEIINDFLQKQDGFIDAEFVKPLEGNNWYFIYHIENLEKLKAVGEKLRSSKLFSEITPLIVPGSLGVTFYRQLKMW
jgi:antibiotic biosynthesis monooxygenase (ABM) superfamily enzyme